VEHARRLRCLIVVVVGLTGGIGAGKSTFAALLADRGAQVIDVDAVGRAVIAAGTQGGEAVQQRFGTNERGALARIVFSDARARGDLEAISWPLIEQQLRILVARPSAEVLVLDMAVLSQGLGEGIYGPVITVEAPDHVRLERLLARGMEERDARARMQAQVSDGDRRLIADFVVVNDRPIDELENEADRILSALRYWVV
jgi:dephospho-CoA kinase